MLIVNRYLVSTPAPVVATNNADAGTGNQSALWGGINPALATGATGNAAAGNGLTNITTVPAYVDQVITTLVQIKFDGTLTAGQPNYVRMPLSNLGITGNKKVRGLCIMGVPDENAGEANNTPTPSWIQATEETAIKVAVVKDCLAIAIPAASIDLYQGKVLSLLICYSNS